MERSFELAVQRISVSSYKDTAIRYVLNASQMFRPAIDSNRPYIYLPQITCDSIAEILGLQFDSMTENYLIDNATHKRLSMLQPELTFQLGIDFDSKDTVVIKLPYTSLSLQLSFPLTKVGNETRYFPIRRATGPTQFVLGRAFLQNAYLIADYDRESFSVHQVRFSDFAPVIREIVPGKIGKTLDSWETSTDMESPRQSTRMSKGAIVGIVCGVVALTVLMFILAFYWRRSNRTKAAEEAKSQDDDSPKALELESKLPSIMQEADPSTCRVEVHNDSSPGEMPDPNGELSGFFSHAELDPDAERLVHELEGSSAPVRSIATTDQKQALAASDESSSPIASPIPKLQCHSTELHHHHRKH